MDEFELDVDDLYSTPAQIAAMVVADDEEELEPPSIEDCVRYLAGVCNYASTWDGHGFNKFDAEYGHKLAAKPEWTDWDRFHGWKLIQKYIRTQLIPAGFAADLVPQPEQPKKPEPIRRVVLGETVEGSPAYYHGWFLIDRRHVDNFQELRAAEASIPGRSWWRDDSQNPAPFYTVVPADATSAKALREYAEKYDFELGPGVPERFYDLIDRAERLISMSRAVRPMSEVTYPEEVLVGRAMTDAERAQIGQDTGETPPPGTLWRLWSHQVAGLQYLDEALKEALEAHDKEASVSATHGALIADQMGTGKTATVLKWVQLHDLFPLLVICPASLKYNWEEEVDKWLPGRKARVLEGTRSQPVSGDVVIANYDIFRMEKNAAQPNEVNGVTFSISMREWGLVTNDECHFLKNPEALRTQMVKRILEEQEQALRMGMSGSPVLNRTQEFVPQLEILNLLKHFGSKHQFERLYCHSWGDRKELNRKLREIPGYLCRTKDHHAFSPDGYLVPLDRIPVYHLPLEMRERNDPEEIRAQIERYGYEFVEGAMRLPPKHRTVQLMTLDNRQEYDRAMAEFREWLREELAKYDDGMERFIRALRAEVLVKIEKLRQLCVKGKMRSALEYIEDILESGEKTVVFVTHTWAEEQVLDRLGKFNPCLITGGQEMRERHEEVTAFQSDPNRLLMVAKLRAGGLGINLTAASRCEMLELDWNPGNQDQGEDRLHRGGQEHPVTIDYLFAAHTIDQTISNLIDAKRSEVTAAIHGGEVEENALIGQMLQAILEDAD